ncbi:MAG: sugar phosphate isomerase/epimerase [Clostridia bacterium]|nr:sugar phosphate isomerase/epimerase [Clostridia bacterium]
MKIGLQMYTMRNQTKTQQDYIETIKKIHEIGYRHLQITTPPFFTVEEHKALLDKYEMTADSVFLPFTQIEANIEKAVADAAIYGVDALRTDSIPQELRGSAEGYRTFAKEANRIGALCREKGLKFVYHFHAFEFINFDGIRGIDILLNETDPENVYFMPDVFWLTNAGTEASRSLLMFKDRAFMMHVKDYAIRQLEGKIESVPFFFAPVGTGNLYWEGIIKSAKDMHMKYLIVEQDECEGDVFEAIKTSFNALQKMGIEA